MLLLVITQLYAGNTMLSWQQVDSTNKSYNKLQLGQPVSIIENCYGTVVPETLDKLAEYSRNDNFEMFATFFRFGYAIYLDKDTRATVMKIQGNKVLIKLDNYTQFWVFDTSLRPIL
ncbi:MAG: hypothetical protein K5856_05250 [Bacteroidaceae bacterium]|nr:hypothetical protein [Bacteroidaceae bacterium]